MRRRLSRYAMALVIVCSVLFGCFLAPAQANSAHVASHVSTIGEIGEVVIFPFSRDAGEALFDPMDTAENVSIRNLSYNNDSFPRRGLLVEIVTVSHIGRRLSRNIVLYVRQDFNWFPIFINNLNKNLRAESRRLPAVLNDSLEHEAIWHSLSTHFLERKVRSNLGFPDALSFRDSRFGRICPAFSMVGGILGKLCGRDGGGHCHRTEHQTNDANVVRSTGYPVGPDTSSNALFGGIGRLPLGAQIGLSIVATLGAIGALALGFVRVIERPRYPAKGLSYFLLGAGLFLIALLPIGSA
jgi:hypothetical protein